MIAILHKTGKYIQKGTATILSGMFCSSKGERLRKEALSQQLVYHFLF